MIQTDHWHADILDTITRLLEADDDLRALIAYGSTARHEAVLDLYSDVDVLLVVAEGALARFFPALDWLRPLGTLFAYEQSSGAGRGVTRVCFDDFRRLDIVITTEATFARDDNWPLSTGWRVLSSHSPTVEQGLERAFHPPGPSVFTSQDVAALANQFWFKATLALTKIMHDALLIALHLALDLVRDCCVLGMLLRDRSEGTTHHRTGGQGNAVVADLDSDRQPYTATGILDSITHSAVAFDSLATRWDSSYQPHRQPLLEWVSHARTRLARH